MSLKASCFQTLVPCIPSVFFVGPRRIVCSCWVIELTVLSYLALAALLVNEHVDKLVGAA